MGVGRDDALRSRVHGRRNGLPSSAWLLSPRAPPPDPRTLAHHPSAQMFDLLGLKSRPAFVDYPSGNDSSRAFDEAAPGHAHGSGGCGGGSCGGQERAQAHAN